MCRPRLSCRDHQYLNISILEAAMERRHGVAGGRVLVKLLMIGAVVSAIPTPARAASIDPVGFCPPPATVEACTTATGIGGETIGVNSTSIGMMKNGGGGTASDPWFLLVAIPNYVGAAPTITFSGDAFTQVGPAEDAGVGDFLPTSDDLYTFAGVTGDASMNAANMFGANEVAAFGGTPEFFEVFKYTFQPQIGEAVPYVLNIGGSGLLAGTFLAADGGTNPFTTPFTMAGLVNGPGCTDCTVTTQDVVPEPATLALLGSGLVFASSWRRKSRT
jgi:hypothetical protein